MIKLSEDKLPRHEYLREYLKENPVEGYDYHYVIDRSDGLGPTAVKWPEDLPHPKESDINSWVESKRSARQAEKSAEKATWDSITTIAALKAYLKNKGIV